MFEISSSHHPYPVSFANIDGSSQYEPSASLKASMISSSLSKIRLESLALSSKNHRSTGLSSGLYAGSGSPSIPKGQLTFPLRWLGEPSKTKRISSSG